MPFWYSFRFQIQIQYRYAPDMDAILILIQIQLSNTVQIRSRHGCHSDTHSNSDFQIQYRYAPDTDAILLLIQIQSPDTTQIRSRHGHHSETYSFDLKLTIQQTLLDGIYKPISNKILSSLQMASLIPFPIPSTINITACKFLGTLVSNHLPPSSREWQISPI